MTVWLASPRAVDQDSSRSQSVARGCVLSVEIAARTSDQLGEGVIWNHVESSLYWVDAYGRAIRRLDPADGFVESWTMPEVIGSLVFDHSGGIVAGLESGFCRVSLDPVEVHTIHNPQPQPGTIFNDGKCDRAGRYFVGTMHADFVPGHGILWRLDPDLSCHRIESDIDVPNGLAWSPDDRVMYFADTRRDVVFRYEYDIDTGTARNRHVFIDTSARPGRIDGATVDSDGNYWAALIHEGAVGCFSPDGEEIRRIDLPVDHPTMCTFGGVDLDLLYVVTSTRFLTDGPARGRELAGSVFVVDDLGVSGIEEPLFAG